MKNCENQRGKSLCHKRPVLVALGVLICAAGILMALRDSAAVPAAAARSLPIYSVERDNKAVSLTFDAAWGDVRVR